MPASLLITVGKYPLGKMLELYKAHIYLIFCLVMPPICLQLLTDFPLPPVAKNKIQRKRELTAIMLPCTHCPVFLPPQHVKLLKPREIKILHQTL